MFDERIEESGLSNRAINCLKRCGIKTVSQLMETSSIEISHARNVGAKTLQEIEDFKSQHMADNFLVEDSRNYDEPRLVIHKVFPELYGMQISSIKFRDMNGEYLDDISVESLFFSLRTVKYLKDYGLMTIRAVAELEYDKFMDIHYLGKKGFDEVLDYLSINAEVATENVRQKLFDDLYGWFRSECNYEENDRYAFITRAIQSNIEDYLAANPERNETLLKDIICRDNVKARVKRLIADSIIGDYACGYEEIKRIIPKVLVDFGLVTDAINELVSEEVIEACNDTYRKKRPTLDDWLDSISFDHKLIIENRLEGATLEECGQLTGVTRERIRQIIVRELNKKPMLREDDYAYWYTTYWFKEDEFIKIFDSDKKTFSYLNLNYSRGSKSIEEMPEDNNLTGVYRRNYYNYLNVKKVLIGGEYIELRRDSICRKLAEVFFSNNETTFENFYHKYVQFLEMNNLQNDDSLKFPTDRAFEARIADSKYVLLKYGKRFRYYPINECDIEELVNQLHFEQYQDVEISTLKLFRDNKELMEEYDIRDEYELHNLLKKTDDKWNPRNKFNLILTRMPLITFGNADRKKQALDLMYQVAPIELDKYAEIYEDVYGMLARTVVANISPLLTEYYHDGVYTTNQPLLDDEAFNYMKMRLTRDFYMTKEIQRIYLQRFGSDSMDYINPRTLKLLGFKVYVNYVVSNKYQNGYEYFKSLLLADDKVDFRALEEGKLTYIQEANKALDDLRKEYSILEYDDMRFISFDKLQLAHPDITKDKLKAFAKDAIDFSDDEFFTIQSLRRDGFSTDLDLGRGSWFYACLIRNYPGVRFIKTGGNLVFRKNPEHAITTVDFFKYLMEKIGKININRFISKLWDEYGLRYDREKVMTFIRDSSLYYDGICEDIYKSEDYYFETLYP
ncbi:Sigma-70, region 4 [Pseudobutyrivibrio sp. 49]|uniref:DNA-directed RNA polymerase subunit alpha C-terminal domain-containing protein n=1 Tax=Pseudobutyrivibrio sp. 49 TaxID=1855344 RepID=UPI0008811AD7|nr:DNA-directed RNA polymerase subunit alpha C-terminal domain-containing protein [Pseudobutyrivibrio sp. 49]SDI57018.1 Sigma-70, region 4 [Pseudobutyrivibrio sp. 49]